MSNPLGFLDSFEYRNVTDDEQLKELVNQARALMQGVNVQVSKNGPMFREQIRSGMQEIASKLDSMIVKSSVRKIRFED